MKAASMNVHPSLAIGQPIEKLDAILPAATAPAAMVRFEGISKTYPAYRGKPGVNALQDIDFAILPGQFAVAENGAVWISDDGVKQRAIYFIAQHLALVVSAIDIVSNMHEAYRRLSFDSPLFGAFISGPSKTADIEQSLVIGAHGPRSMTVFIVG